MKKETMIAILLLSLLVVTNFSMPVNGENREKSIYPMYGINAQHNFQSRFSAKDNDGHLADVKALYLTPWLVIDGRYIYGINEGDLFSPAYIVKYDIKTGERIWSTKNSFGFEYGEEPILLLSNDTLYLYISVGDYSYTGHREDAKTCNQNIWAISTKDGQVLWRYEGLKALEKYYHKSFWYLSDSGHSIPVIDNKGTIYMSVSGYNDTSASVYNAIVAINSNGTTKWVFGLDTHDWWEGLAKGLTLDTQGNIYALTNKYLYSISPNGTLRWKIRLNLKMYGGTSIYNNRVYFVGRDANTKEWKLFSYTTDGKFLWYYKIENFEYIREFYTPTIAPDGNIYLTDGKEIYSISPNGTLNWKLKISNLYFIVADRDDYIYFSTGKGIYKVSPSGKAKVLYVVSDYEYGIQGLSSYVFIGPDQTIYSIYYTDGGGTYLYIFDNNPFAFLKNPIFITAIVVIIAVPVAYFTIRKIRKKEVKGE